ncbi:MarR family winged helix-turn-helix transcriptional regulator [Reinekea marinisedimentorum]|uniref:DNA-binding MarR family transcriptional regulator n=1 Tax=Reinekea marinisedimentorum TaxID=230495 RepID=A0A4V2UK90_9GAMM|nr:hypothetical protein [Reinekea marinisedimentorum]TCS43312.1 DNA-binding MarR family transcriptional regulator [Reinekea marinisedimentorum]
MKLLETEFKLSLYCVNVLSEAIDSKVKQALKDINHDNISPRDLGILIKLARSENGKMDLLDAYRREMRARSTVSDTAKRLEKHGYLCKESASGNAKNIVLSAKPKALELHNAVTPEITQIVDQLFTGFTEEEKIQFMRLTGRAYENLTGRKIKGKSRQD